MTDSDIKRLAKQNERADAADIESALAAIAAVRQARVGRSGYRIDHPFGNAPFLPEVARSRSDAANLEEHAETEVDA